jgi:UDP-N-acetylglucosamine--N-acetylmuramyl-(pentapeptide) pyrophosphoryl-undecaprenol N-acetylglucosamine transferase
MTQLISTCIKALRILRMHKVEEIVSTGGYISIPVCFAARMLKIPICLYELNVIPGRASYTIASWATRVYICFTQTKSYFKNIICTQAVYPIRFNQTEKAITKEQAINALAFNHIKKTIFIAGGSQGSLFINTLIKNWLTLNPHVHSLVQIIHQTGAQDTTNWKTFYAEHEIPALVFDYKDSLAIEYMAADLIICRAGAGTLFEILFFNKPCLVIPLETRSTDHQKDNAAAMAAQHPELFSVLHESQIKKNNTVLFSAINKHLYYKTAPVFKDKLVFE